MRTVCALFAVVCFGTMIANLMCHESDPHWVEHSITLFICALSGIFNYVAAQR